VAPLALQLTDLLDFKSAGQQQVNTASVLAAQLQLSEHLPWLYTINLLFQSSVIVTAFRCPLKLGARGVSPRVHCSLQAIKNPTSFTAYYLMQLLISV